MCGIFAWIGHADPAIIEEIVTLAASRGPHSHGYAELHYGSFHTHRGEGDSTNALAMLLDEPARACLGHSRLATVGWNGDRVSLDDTMPFLVGRCAVVHNGNVTRYKEIATDYHFKLRTDCDSEIIAHLYDRFSQPSDRCDPLRLTVEAIDEGRPYVIAVLDRYGRLILRRRGLPLYAGGIDQAAYICSREFSNSVLIPESRTVYTTQAVGSWLFDPPKELV